jgi:hypothetical protein
MKLFVVTCIKEHLNDVSKIFNEANIAVFSTTDIIGYKREKLSNRLEDWFASSDERFDSLMIFSFTSAENADKGIGLIKNYNKTRQQDFPVRAFILPVEKSIY